MSTLESFESKWHSQKMSADKFKVNAIENNVITDYENASKDYFKAAQIAKELIDKGLPSDLLIDWELRMYYCQYEQYTCLSQYQNKNEKFDDAITYANRASQIAAKAVSSINEFSEKQDIELQKWLINKKVHFEYSVYTSEIQALEAKAKKLRKEKKFIEALDIYYDIIKALKDNLDFIQENSLKSSFHRTALGNAKAMEANLAQIQIEIHKERESISKAFELKVSTLIISNYLATCKYLTEAYEANPENKLYLDEAIEIENKLKVFLAKRKKAWSKIIEKLPSNHEIFLIMNKIDKKELDKIKVDKALSNDKFKKTVQYTVFYLAIVIVLLATLLYVFTIINGIYLLIVAIIALLLFIVVVSSAMRSVGDLSETGYLKQISLVLKVFLRLNRDSNNENDNNTAQND